MGRQGTRRQPNPIPNPIPNPNPTLNPPDPSPNPNPKPNSNPSPPRHATLLTVHGSGFFAAGDVISYTKQVLVHHP